MPSFLLQKNKRLHRLNWRVTGFIYMHRRTFTHICECAHTHTWTVYTLQCTYTQTRTEPQQRLVYLTWMLLIWVVKKRKLQPTVDSVVYLHQSKFQYSIPLHVTVQQRPNTYFPPQRRNTNEKEENCRVSWPFLLFCFNTLQWGLPAAYKVPGISNQAALPKYLSQGRRSLISD